MALILKGRARLKGSTVINRLPYSVGEFVPELVADFKNEYYRKSSESITFSGLITHTRASTATYVDADGILQTAATNVPRVGHHVWNGTAWVNEGLLHESEARTNLMTYSEQFDNAVWIKSKASITHNIVVAPYGTLTGDKLVEDTTAGEHYIDGTVVYTAGTYTFSIYAKAAEKNQFRLRPVHVGANEGATSQAVFNLDTGASSSLSGGAVSASTQNVGNGWWRCSLTITVTGTFSLTRFRVQLEPTTYTGDGTSGIYVWGAQLEAGTTPSSYIPTSSSTVTRSADVLTIPAANLPYNSTALSIQMDGRVTYADTGTLTIGAFLRWFSSSTSQIRTDLNSIGTNTGLITFVQIDGANVDTVSTGANALSPSVLASFNIASRHGSTFVNGAIDGTALTANTTPVALPDLSTTNLQLGFAYNGTIRTFRMWGQDITDAGLVEATEPSLVPSLSLTFDGTENSFIVEDWSA